MPDGTTFRQYSNKIEDIIGVPALSNPGSAGDLRSGKQLAGADGSVVTGTMPETAGKTVTPTTTDQTAVASGRYTTGDVVVSGDANLVPENIAEGVSIFGVQGTHSGGGTFQTCAGAMPVSGFIPVFVFLNADGELEAHSGGGSSDASQRIVVGSIINFGTTVNVSGGLVNIDNRRYRVTGNFTARPSGGPPD